MATVAGTAAELFALLRTASPEFHRLARRHREIGQQMVRYDRIYYLTSEQERQLKELREQMLAVKDEMSRLMRQHTEGNGRCRCQLCTPPPTPGPALA